MDDPRKTESPELDRSARRTSSRLSHMLGGGDDDDYFLQAMAISDGFRPVDVAQDLNLSHVARPSVSSLEPPVARTVSPRPSSVSKPAPPHDSFSPPRPGVQRAPMRSSAASTDSAIISAESPYDGPSGPSHPYQMYPQDVRMARTASLATTSTAAVSERSYTGPHRPAHPYGTYSQTVAAGDDGSSGRSPPSVINIGFPGAVGDYQRRLGPDGEEAADIIGPDGHTEQLPPYTRYPVEAYTQKSVGMNIAQITPMPSPTQQNLEIPGAGGIGLATRNPEFSSTEDLNILNSPQSRRSIRSFTSEASHHSINTAALAVTNEKSLPNWKVVARRKVWGIVPCWAVVLAVIVLVLLGVVIGTVIGTVIGPHLNKSPRKKPPPGFIFLPTVPPNLPPLDEGVYSIGLFGPRYSNTCFENPSLGRAWNCDAILSQLTMTIRRRQNAPDIAAYALDFTYNHSYTQDSFVYTYGVQPPSLIDLQLQLVNDTYERTRGPAWAFALPYNKTVILPEEYLSLDNVSTSSDEVQRRMMFGSDFKRKGLAQAGEKPWICTWPGTLLEVVIYASQNSSFKFPSSSSSSPAASPTGSPTESSAGAPSVTAHRRNAMGQPNDDDNHGAEYPPHTRPPTPRPTSSSATSSESSTTSQTSPAPDYFGRPPMMPPPMYPTYPRVIKVEERRDPIIGGPMPVCRQVEIIDKGVLAVPVLNDKREPIEIQIAEVTADGGEKESDSYYVKRHSFEQHLSSRGDGGLNGNELSDCGCLWWMT
ncbi:hypothetical protein F4802DRAFT_43933 [Xylaria palmicola]|nr:hypothetical protein F4802DRAFT_43933 [Xylaria palmicola]